MKSLGYTIFAYICGTTPYAFPQYCYTSFTHHPNAPYCKAFSHFLRRQGPSSPIFLLYCLYPPITIVKLLWDSWSFFLHVTMRYVFPFLPWALCCRSSRCSFLNKITNILKIPSSMLNSTATYFLYIITVMLNQLMITVYRFCAYYVISLKF